MNQFLIIVVFVLLLFTPTLVSGNDTTSLTKERIEQVKRFSDWLDDQQNGELNKGNQDSVSANYYRYDSAVSLFFDRRTRDSLFAIDERTKYIKYQYQLTFFSNYDRFINSVPFDSLKISSYSSIHEDYQLPGDTIGFKNTVIVYLSIDGKKYELFWLHFANNSPKLIGLQEVTGNGNIDKNFRAKIAQLIKIKSKSTF